MVDFSAAAAAAPVDANVGVDAVFAVVAITRLFNMTGTTLNIVL